MERGAKAPRSLHYEKINQTYQETFYKETTKEKEDILMQDQLQKSKRKYKIAQEKAMKAKQGAVDPYKELKRAYEKPGKGVKIGNGYV